MEAKTEKSYYGKPSFKTRDTIRLIDALNQAQAPYKIMGGTSRVNPRQIGSGTLGGTQFVGSPNQQISGSNQQQLLSDGITNRLLIGYQAGGF